MCSRRSKLLTERGVIFRLGRVLPQPKGPGVILVFAPIDRIVRISLRIEAMEVPPQDVITRDNVTVKVNAVVYFRVLDPTKAVLEVTNFLYATSLPDYTSDGLRLLAPDQGIAAWSVLSAPTLTYQKLYNFYTDSYVDLTIALPIDKTTITQHYQDIRKRTGFKTGRVYNMFSGQADEQFRAQAKIEVLNIGSTADLQGPSAVLGLQIENGLALAVNKQNQQGIIPGWLLALTILNDSHSPIKSRRNIEELLKDFNTKIMIGVEESVLLSAYFDLVLKKEFLVMFPFSGVAKLRAPTYTNIMHYGPSYR